MKEEEKEQEEQELQEEKEEIKERVKIQEVEKGGDDEDENEKPHFTLRIHGKVNELIIIPKPVSLRVL